MAIQFYLTIDSKRYMLPVNPSEIRVRDGSNNDVSEVVKLGEINQLGVRSLTETSITCFFPADYSRPYVSKGSTELSPKGWVKLLLDAKNSNKTVRLIVTDTDINLLMSIEDFEHSYVDSTGDVEYTIDLKEYREYAAKYVKTVAKKVSTAKKVATQPVSTAAITIGCTVIVNGRLHRDSYGTGPGRTEVNATRKVNFIKLGRSHPYHVTMLDGGWRGWVTAGSVRRV